ncbi:hypothetical protein [Pedobacter sp. AJM]|uniref:hypothetical protein n=1 Tax=Pedobacter sp. AJM TaxID=2003629 RepID=UPI000B4BE071|nr:hypothetical protein [Pedobacter sp. AJM]OWK69857.1 hypothetical protein CBW18_14715 [Pedobacter sp. AJM]
MHTRHACASEGVATEFLDINSSQIKSIEKKFYLTICDEFIDADGLPDFGQLSFYYKEDLTIVEINLPSFEDDNYRITDNENILNNLLIRPLFKWEDHPYYQNATPFCQILQQFKPCQTY